MGPLLTTYCARPAAIGGWVGWCTVYINQEVDPSTDITLRGNNPTTSLISSDVDWILSKQIIFIKLVLSYQFLCYGLTPLQLTAPGPCLRDLIDLSNRLHKCAHESYVLAILDSLAVRSYCFWQVTRSCSPSARPVTGKLRLHLFGWNVTDDTWDEERRTPCDKMTHGTERDGDHVQLDLVCLRFRLGLCIT